VFIRVHSRLIQLSLGMYKSNRVRVQRQVAHIHMYFSEIPNPATGVPGKPGFGLLGWDSG